MKKYRDKKIQVRFSVSLNKDSALIFEDARESLESHIGKPVDRVTMISFLCAHYLASNEYKLSREYIQIEQASVEVLNILKEKYGFNPETCERDNGEEFPNIEETGAGLRRGSTRSFCPTCGRSQRGLTFVIAEGRKTKAEHGGRTFALTLFPRSSQTQDRSFQAPIELQVRKSTTTHSNRNGRLGVRPRARRKNKITEADA